MHSSWMVGTNRELTIILKKKNMKIVEHRFEQITENNLDDLLKDINRAMKLLIDYITI